MVSTAHEVPARHHTGTRIPLTEDTRSLAGRRCELVAGANTPEQRRVAGIGKS